MSLTLADLSPEIRLLLACCHAQLNEARQAVLFAAVDAVREWSRVPALAREYMVSPLVHQHLKAHAADRVPAEVMAQLARQRQRAVRHNLLLVAELKRLVRDWLEPMGIAYVAFKGPVLAQALYGDIGLRQSRDLDVLVEASRLHELVQHLLAAGYRPMYAHHARTPKRLAAICHFLPVVNLRSPEGIHLELHKELGTMRGGFPVTSEWVFDNAMVEDLYGLPLHVMPKKEAALYLCYHHGRHQWSRMHWLADLNALLDQDETQLAAISERANALRMFERWQSSVYLHSRLQGKDMPPSTSAAMENCNCVIRILAGQAPKPEEVAPNWFSSRRARWLGRAAMAVKAWNSQRDWRSRFRYVQFILRPAESDIVWLDLPRPLYGIYWLIRPLRWLWELRRRELPPVHEHA